MDVHEKQSGVSTDHWKREALRIRQTQDECYGPQDTVTDRGAEVKVLLREQRWRTGSVTRRSIHACYTDKTVTKGFLWTLLVALGLWGSFHVPLLMKGTPASCQSACGCCMHGGMCPMMAAKAHMASGSKCVTGHSRSHSGVSCSCSVSHPTVPLMQASHADLLFNQPRMNLSFKLPLSNRRAGRHFAFLPAPGGRLPDPPPKTFSS
jgi:hypothetical protein